MMIFNNFNFLSTSSLRNCCRLALSAINKFISYCSLNEEEKEEYLQKVEVLKEEILEKLEQCPSWEYIHKKAGYEPGAGSEKFRITFSL
jgi:hypothetical protein